MDAASNTLNWFEIPVNDIERAMKFYEDILGISLQFQDFGNFKMALFPFENGSGKLSGALCQGDPYLPSQEGCLVYLNCNPDLKTVLDKVEEKGGFIMREKTQISPEHGFMALITDTEGNKIALHSTD